MASEKRKESPFHSNSNVILKELNHAYSSVLLLIDAGYAPLFVGAYQTQHWLPSPMLHDSNTSNMKLKNLIHS